MRCCGGGGADKVERTFERCVTSVELAPRTYSYPSKLATFRSPSERVKRYEGFTIYRVALRGTACPGKLPDHSYPSVSSDSVIRWHTVAIKRVNFANYISTKDYKVLVRLCFRYGF